MTRRGLSLGRIALACAALLAGGGASAQSLGVSPVSLQMAPGQAVTTLTLTNQGDRPTAIQIRAFAWNHDSGADELIPSDRLIVSPPISTIAPSGTQVVRLMLRQVPQVREETYRILIDQIPAAAEPGTVSVALRLSIPVFATPSARITPQLAYRIEQQDGRAWLVAVNTGTRHETVRNISLATGDGRSFKTAATASPYVLGGSSRSWPIVEPDFPPAAGATARLTAHGDHGAILVTIPVAVRR